MATELNFGGLSAPAINATNELSGPSTNRVEHPEPAQQFQQPFPDIFYGINPALPVLYVNAKQFHRILKRRIARRRLEEQFGLTSNKRKPYMHQSRHNNAKRRPRGLNGRFLTADELAAMKEKADKGDTEKKVPDEGTDVPASVPKERDAQEHESSEADKVRG